MHITERTFKRYSLENERSLSMERGNSSKKGQRQMETSIDGMYKCLLNIAMAGNLKLYAVKKNLKLYTVLSSISGHVGAKKLSTE